MARKGVALPMETIVIIAIVVIVLVVIIAFFVTGAGRQTTAITTQEALARGCTTFALPPFNCDVNKLQEVSIVNYQGGLEKACKDSGYFDNAQCAQLACRCPAP